MISPPYFDLSELDLEKRDSPCLYKFQQMNAKIHENSNRHNF